MGLIRLLDCLGLSSLTASIRITSFRCMEWQLLHRPNHRLPPTHALWTRRAPVSQFFEFSDANYFFSGMTNNDDSSNIFKRGINNRNTNACGALTLFSLRAHRDTIGSNDNIVYRTGRPVLTLPLLSPTTMNSINESRIINKTFDACIQK